jgi:hypothetical protein
MSRTPHEIEEEAGDMSGALAPETRRHKASFDNDAIAGIVRYCTIAGQHGRGSAVSFSDSAERHRIRDEFLRKTLGLTQSDADLDAAIAAVADAVQTATASHRVTVYYLLAERFGKLTVFL